MHRYLPNGNNNNQEKKTPSNLFPAHIQAMRIQFDKQIKHSPSWSYNDFYSGLVLDYNFNTQNIIMYDCQYNLNFVNFVIPSTIPIKNPFQPFNALGVFYKIDKEPAYGDVIHISIPSDDKSDSYQKSTDMATATYKIKLKYLTKKDDPLASYPYSQLKKLIAKANDDLEIFKAWMSQGHQIPNRAGIRIISLSEPLEITYKVNGIPVTIACQTIQNNYHYQLNKKYHLKISWSITIPPLSKMKNPKNYVILNNIINTDWGRFINNVYTKMTNTGQICLFFPGVFNKQDKQKFHFLTKQFSLTDEISPLQITMTQNDLKNGLAKTYTKNDFQFYHNGKLVPADQISDFSIGFASSKDIKLLIPPLSFTTHK